MHYILMRSQRNSPRLFISLFSILTATLSGGMAKNFLGNKNKKKKGIFAARVGLMKGIRSLGARAAIHFACGMGLEFQSSKCARRCICIYIGGGLNYSVRANLKFHTWRY